MITNANVSKTASASYDDFAEIKNYVGVASVNIIAVNPNNATLREAGWSIPEDANEPEYLHRDENGKIDSARVRLLARIMDLEEKPVIPLDFWIRPDVKTNKDGTKCKIIDPYCRTAWATSDDVKTRSIPTYSTGNKADISPDYKLCHIGEEEFVAFLAKYFNITPYQRFVRATRGANDGHWEKNDNPGMVTINDWKALCSGNVTEVEGDFKNPETKNNCVKVILGVRQTENNKIRQVFITGGLRDNAYLSNAMPVDKFTGEYNNATKGIQRFNESHPNTVAQYTFSAAPVKEWKLASSNVEDNSGEEANIFESKEDDLPF